MDVGEADFALQYVLDQAGASLLIVGVDNMTVWEARGPVRSPKRTAIASPPPDSLPTARKSIW